MGNAFSNSNAIHVQTSKPYYFPGEVLEGVVAVNVLQTINTDGIDLQVLGYEDTHFTTNETRTSDTDSGTRSHHGHFDFLRVTAPLGPPGVLNPGQYQFGFKLQLPDTCPPSFRHSHGGDGGKVKYKMIANVAKTGFDIKTEQELMIYERPVPPEATRPAGNSASQNVNCCCCISKGSASLRVTLEKDCFARGEPVSIAIEARNNTTSDFGVMEVSLKRRVTVQASDFGYYTDSSTQSPVTIDIQGLMAGEVAEGGMARRATLVMSPDLPPSLTGKLIQCYYVIKVKLEGGFGMSDVETQVPVRILASAPDANARIDSLMQAPPAGWAPSNVYPTMDLSQNGGMLPPPPPVASGPPPPAAGNFYAPPPPLQQQMFPVV